LTEALKIRDRSTLTLSVATIDAGASCPMANVLNCLVCNID
jgi:hypothetical protein